MLGLAKYIIQEFDQQIKHMKLLNHEINEALLTCFKSESFTQAYAGTLKASDFSARGVLTLLVDHCDVLSTKTVEEWLGILYQYALSLTYPTAVTQDLDPTLKPVYVTLLEFLRVLNLSERNSHSKDFLSLFPFKLITPEEVNQLENKEEYEIILKAFRYDYIYEMMKLNYETTGHSTIEHIVGVHHVALHLARQIKALGLPIDLGIVSGAAAFHDIGKFGCKADEKKMVAYYHYYYTEEWFYRKNIQYIRNIAVNHSTWDLELENLSLESLVLIYSDFKVKRHKDPTWPYAMKFFGIDEAFQVILDKLDHVDEAKEKRYRKVYYKLKDFECYIQNLGVQTEIGHANPPCMEKIDLSPVLQFGDASIFKYQQLAIENNIAFMYQLRNEASLSGILDLAREQKDPHKLRQFMRLFEQFTQYLTPEQKLLTLDFFFETLLRVEEDLRRQASRIMGKIIASFDDPYSKYLPPTVDQRVFKLSKSGVLKKYIESFLDPELVNTTKKTEWVGLALGEMVKYVTRFSKEIEHTVDLLLNLLKDILPHQRRFILNIFALLPTHKLTQAQLNRITDIVVTEVDSDIIEDRMAAYDIITHLIKTNHDGIIKIAKMIVQTDYELPYEQFLSGKVKRRLKRVLDQPIEVAFDFTRLDEDQVSDLYLSNLKTATPGLVKKLQVEMILEHMLHEGVEGRFYAAIHYCNLLKNSSSQEVRLIVSKALLALVERLNPRETNEIVIELLRGLEIETYQFTQAIPSILGKLLFMLNTHEIEEILDDLLYKVKKGSAYLKSLVVETMGHAVAAWSVANRQADQSEALLKKMLSILLTGLVQYDSLVHQVAFHSITHDILTTKSTTLQEKHHVFKYLHKKMLCMMAEHVKGMHDDPMLYAHGLNQLYVFITEYLHEFGPFDYPKPEKVAYFPGTFDPYSLGQHKVAQQIRDQGYEVYIAIDAFNWMRRTQATLMRRRMIELTIANEFDIYLFPAEVSIYANNDEDIEALQTFFGHIPIYWTIGEDLMLSQDVYEKDHAAIYQIPHLLIKRDTVTHKKRELLSKRIDHLKHVAHMHIDAELERITPHQIRKAIDHKWDMMDYLDPMVEQYIYTHNLYRNEPQFKATLEFTRSKVMNFTALSDDLKDEIMQTFTINLAQVAERHQGVSLKDLKVLVIRDIADDSLQSMAVYRELTAHEHAKVHDDQEIKSHYVDIYAENTAVIELIFAKPSELLHNHMRNILVESLVELMNNGYEYVLYESGQGGLEIEVLKALRLAGFVEIQGLRQLIVSLKSPIVLLLDAQSMLKSSFRQDLAIRRALSETRESLMHQLVKLYPRHAILSFDRSMMYDHMSRIIQAHNAPQEGQPFGPAICVPFGDLFKRWRLPGSITKALHTERVYEPMLRYFDIKAHPYYMTLKHQINVFKSFNRPVILIDDLLDTGLRLQAIEQYIKTADIQVQEILVAVMSEKGKKRMQQKGYHVSAAYEVPNMRAWFTESQLYPFIGGDSFWLEANDQNHYLSSVNKILPYLTSQATTLNDKNLFIAFSEVCLRNAHKLLSALQQHYQVENRRPLTIDRLDEVFITPRVPQYGKGVFVDIHAQPTTMIENDIRKLIQIDKLSR